MKIFCLIRFSIVGNVVWDDDFTASRVLIAIGKDIQKPAGDKVLNILFILFVSVASQQSEAGEDCNRPGGGKPVNSATSDCSQPMGFSPS